MDLFALFTSRQGRLAEKPFWVALFAVYVAGFASQALLSAQVMGRSGLWPFIIVQAVLIWAWIVLHIKRLHDAGRSGGSAIGVATIYMLALALMIIFIAFFAGLSAGAAAEQAHGEQGPMSNLIGLMIALAVLDMLYSPDFGAIALVLKGLVLIACLPVIISLVFSLWAGTRPSVPAA